MDKDDVVSIYNDYCSVIKQEILSFATTTWMDHGGIMLSEITQQMQKGKIVYDFIYMWNSLLPNKIKLTEQMGGYRGQVGWEDKMDKGINYLFDDG